MNSVVITEAVVGVALLLLGMGLGGWFYYLLAFHPTRAERRRQQTAQQLAAAQAREIKRQLTTGPRFPRAWAHVSRLCERAEQALHDVRTAVWASPPEQQDCVQNLEDLVRHCRELEAVLRPPTEWPPSDWNRMMPLLMASLVTTLLLITTIALLTLGATEPRIAQNHLAGTQAFYLAESGLEVALARLNAGQWPLTSGTLETGTYAVSMTTAAQLLYLVDRNHMQIRSRGQAGQAVRVYSNTFERAEDGVWRPLKLFRGEEP